MEELIKAEAEAQETLDFLNKIPSLTNSSDYELYNKLRKVYMDKVECLKLQKISLQAENEKTQKLNKQQNIALKVVLLIVLAMLAAISFFKTDLSIVFIVFLSLCNVYLIISNYHFVNKTISIISIAMVVVYGFLSWYSHSCGSNLLDQISSFILPGMTISSFFAVNIKEYSKKNR